ncbi:MAG: AsmA family protein, partial [Candidatus Binatus sp.]
MRSTLLIAGIVVGAVVLIAAGLTVYAYFNLSSIVAHSEGRILARVSDELGRRVEVGKIQARMGWGVSVEVSGLTIADDPAFSTRPFLAAGDVSVDVEFFPLLHGEAKVIELELIKPDIRLVMNANGDLNLGTIGSRGGGSRHAQSPNTGSRGTKKSSLAQLSIKALSIEDGEIHFKDLSEKAAPILVRHLNFDVTDFNAASAFNVETKFAFPGDVQNVEAAGKLGPLLNQGVLDAKGIPVDLKLKLDAILLDNLRPLADIGSDIPPALSIRDPVSINGTARGSFGKLAIAMSTDLTANRVAYAAIFDKPAGTAMTVNTNGAWGDQLQIASVNVKLSDLELTASRISGVVGPQPLKAQIDSNSFNLANLAAMISAAAGYGVAGTGEVHGTVRLGNNAPAIDGSVTLKQAALKPPSWPGGLNDLNGTIRFANGIEVVERTSFTFGSAHANLEGRVESLTPLKASYALKADTVKLAQIFASRPPGDIVNQLVVKGTA